MTSTAMQHLRHLAESIGPRGSTTAQEQEAAAYLRERFEAAGLETHWEPFTAPVSGWRPFALAALAGLASVALTVAAGRAGALVAALLMTVATVSVFLEMYFRPNPLRAFVRRGQSQNVWARVPASQTPRRRVLLVGHLDTHGRPGRSSRPCAWCCLRAVTGARRRRLRARHRVLRPRRRARPRGAAPVPAPAGARVPGRAGDHRAARHHALHARRQRQCQRRLGGPEPGRAARARAAGAHRGVGAGERLRGGGLVRLAGVHRAPRDELPGLLVISIDNVGGAGAGVCYTSVEGMVFPLRPSPELFALAESLRREYPEGLVYARPYTVLHTDATAFMSRGVPSLSFVGLTSTGRDPGLAPGLRHAGPGRQQHGRAHRGVRLPAPRTHRRGPTGGRRGAGDCDVAAARTGPRRPGIASAAPPAPARLTSPLPRTASRR
jgi:hypothetical protein